MPQTRVYHYVNPANGNHITSLLPPDHPEMVCLQRGSHIEETKFGFLGEFLSFRFAHVCLLSFCDWNGADVGFLDRYRCGYRLVSVGNWALSFGQDRYL